MEIIHKDGSIFVFDYFFEAHHRPSAYWIHRLRNPVYYPDKVSIRISSARKCSGPVLDSVRYGCLTIKNKNKTKLGNITVTYLLKTC